MQKILPIDEAVVAEIHKLHKRIEGRDFQNLEDAIKIGELLTREKAKLKHGEWMRWMKQNLEFSQPMASRYVRIYENPELFIANNFTFTQACYYVDGRAPHGKKKVRLRRLSTDRERDLLEDVMEVGKISLQRRAGCSQTLSLKASVETLSQLTKKDKGQTRCYTPYTWRGSLSAFRPEMNFSTP